MIQIDPKAGSHFNGKQIGITTHAEEQAQNKFGIKFKAVTHWIETNLRKAQYIGEVLDEKDEKRRLFGHNRIAFILSLDADIVITVYPRLGSKSTIRDRVQEIVQKEIQKNKRTVEALERRILLEKADLRVELAETERRQLRCRSEAVRLVCQARIQAIKERIGELEKESDQAKQDHSTLLKGVVAYV